MPVYLDEAMFGTATDVIGFPHLLVCMGVVAMTRNALYGVHLDKRQDTGVLSQELAIFMAGRNVTGTDIVALYGCANHEIRYANVGNRLQAWRLEMQEIATALGYHGPARGFDTSIIAPQDGTYVEYIPDYPAQRCRIYYKRNEKMNYGTTDHSPATGFNPDIKQYSSYSGRISDVYTEKTTANIKVTMGNKGLLHEVDYARRLSSFDI